MANLLDKWEKNAQQSLGGSSMLDQWESNAIQGGAISAPRPPADEGILSNIFKGAKVGAANTVGGVAGWIGGNNAVTDWAEDVAQSNQRSREHDGYDLDYFLNGSGLAYDFGNLLGSFASMAPIGFMIPEAAGGATAAGIASLLGRAGASALARRAAIEAAKKGGGALGGYARYGLGAGTAEALAEGGSGVTRAFEEGVDNPYAVGAEIFAKNWPLLVGSQALEGGILHKGFSRLGGKAGESLGTRAWKAPFRTAPYMAGEGLTEAAQEVMQERAQEEAFNEPTGGILPSDMTENERKAFYATLAPAALLGGVGGFRGSMRAKGNEPEGNAPAPYVANWDNGMNGLDTDLFDKWESAPGMTDLTGVRRDVVAALNGLANEYGGKITITGAAEKGVHAEGEDGHEGGWKVDIDKNLADPEKFLELAAKYGFAVGDEGDHYDLSANRKGGVGGKKVATPDAFVSDGQQPSGHREGHENAWAIYDVFKAAGYNDNAIAGILGRVQQEHNFDTSDVPEHEEEGMHLGGYGMFQWNGGRTTAFLNWAQENGLDPQSATTQAQYALLEAQQRGLTPEKMNQLSHEEAADLWTSDWEVGKPGDERKYAGEWLQRLQNGGGVAGGTTTTNSNETPKAPKVDTYDDVYEQFAREQSQTSDEETKDFFSGMFTKNGKFIDNEENRRQIDERYGEELKEFADVYRNPSVQTQIDRLIDQAVKAKDYNRVGKLQAARMSGDIQLMQKYLDEAKAKEAPQMQGEPVPQAKPAFPIVQTGGNVNGNTQSTQNTQTQPPQGGNAVNQNQNAESGQNEAEEVSRRLQVALNNANLNNWNLSDEDKMELQELQRRLMTLTGQKPADIILPKQEQSGQLILPERKGEAPQAKNGIMQTAEDRIEANAQRAMSSRIQTAIRNHDYDTALDLARQSGREELANLIESIPVRPAPRTEGYDTTISKQGNIRPTPEEERRLMELAGQEPAEIILPNQRQAGSLILPEQKQKEQPASRKPGFMQTAEEKAEENAARALQSRVATALRNRDYATASDLLRQQGKDKMADIVDSVPRTSAQSNETIIQHQQEPQKKFTKAVAKAVAKFRKEAEKVLQSYADGKTTYEKALAKLETLMQKAYNGAKDSNTQQAVMDEYAKYAMELENIRQQKEAETPSQAAQESAGEQETTAQVEEPTQGEKPAQSVAEPASNEGGEKSAQTDEESSSVPVNVAENATTTEQTKEPEKVDDDYHGFLDGKGYGPVAEIRKQLEKKDTSFGTGLLTVKHVVERWADTDETNQSQTKGKTYYLHGHKVNKAVYEYYNHLILDKYQRSLDENGEVKQEAGSNVATKLRERLDSTVQGYKAGTIDYDDMKRTLKKIQYESFAELKKSEDEAEQKALQSVWEDAGKAFDDVRDGALKSMIIEAPQEKPAEKQEEKTPETAEPKQEKPAEAENNTVKETAKEPVEEAKKDEQQGESTSPDGGHEGARTGKGRSDQREEAGRVSEHDEREGEGHGSDNVEGHPEEPKPTGVRAGTELDSSAGTRTDKRGNQSDVPLTEAQAHPSATETPGHNYEIKESGGEPNKRNADVRYKQNIDAIKLLRQLEDEERMATPAEQDILAQFNGWGGLSAKFKEGSETDKELRSLLSAQEYKDAQSSSLSAYYTPPKIVKAIWAGLSHLGFKGGRILDPAMGVGNFFGCMPRDMMAKSVLDGVEMESLTARLARQLYPGADVQNTAFQRSNTPKNFYDLVITNVPFEQVTVNGYQVHNYYFAAGIDKVRPGGLMVYITGQGSLSSGSDAARMRTYLNKEADLIGAFKLPSGVFDATNVGTDVVVFQKRIDGKKSPHGHEFTNVQNRGSYGVNTYFMDNRDNILGEMSVGVNRFGQPELNVRRRKDTTNEDVAKDLESAMKKLPEGIYQPVSRNNSKPFNPSETAKRAKADDKTRDREYYYKDGKIVQNQNGQETEIKGKQAEVVESYVKLKNSLNALLAAETDPKATDKQVEGLRDMLNRDYNDFVKKHGYLHGANKRHFDDDPSSGMVQSLETPVETEEKTKNGATKKKITGAKKASIFSERSTNPKKEVTHVDTASDALVASLNNTGGLDLEYMAKLAGKTQEQLLSELKGTIFKDPVTEDFVTKDEYLSGNVREKLILAKEMAKRDKSYAANVKALEEVQPEELVPEEIFVSLGTPWIPAQDVNDFVHTIANGKFTVHYNSALAKWTVTGWLNSTKFGTQHIAFDDFLTKVLNGQVIEIKYTDEDKKTHVDEAATKAVTAEAERLQAAFKGWIWKDKERAKRLTDYYNANFNNYVLREYDGSHLDPHQHGANSKITLRSHQKDAVWRILQSGNTLLAHCVGAGKTFTMQTAGMEMRRLGMANKPMYLLPLNVVDQFAQDFRKLYPGAKLLVLTNEDLPQVKLTKKVTKTADGRIEITDLTKDMSAKEKERIAKNKAKRARTLARIRTEDWDGIIMSHTLFKELPVSPETQTAYMEEEFKRLEDALKEAQQTKSLDGRAMYTLEQRKAKLQEKMEEARNVDVKDLGVTFEQLGIDQLFVDEADLFKNLHFITGKDDIKGITNPAESYTHRAFDMFIKTQWLGKMLNGRGVVFATGTPISNSMAELYTMMRYLDPQGLKEHGVELFDSWIGVFGDIGQDTQLNSTGTKWETVTKVRSYNNRPELLKMFRKFADIKQPNELPDIKRPELKGGKPTIVELPADPAVSHYLKERVPKRISAMTGGFKKQKGEDNMLALMNDLRNLSLSNSKIEACADHIVEEYNNSTAVKGTQLVFCDLGIPKAESKKEDTDEEEGFSKKVSEIANPDVYRKLIEKLVKKGIPREQIAFIQDYPKAKRQAIFEKVNNGEIRILIGSTTAMGAGTNCQKHLVALHDLDAPWRPRDLEQRHGRILRQGNENGEVSIYQYALKGSFDAVIWSKLKEKALLIELAMSGDMNSRSMEEADIITLEYSEMVGASLDDPLMKEKVDTENELSKVRNAQTEFSKKVQKADRTLETIDDRIGTHEKAVEHIKKDIADRKSTRGDNFSMTVGNKTFTKRNEAESALEARLKDFDESKPTVIGGLGGFAVKAVKTITGLEMEVVGKHAYPVKTMSVQGLEHTVNVQIDDTLEHEEAYLEYLNQEKKDALDIHGQENPYTEKVKNLEEKLADLNRQIKERAVEESKKQSDTETEEAQEEKPSSNRKYSIDGKPIVGVRNTAWHGTPHDFETFSLDAVGSGEGLQYYGYGLYFSKGMDVGARYRKGVTSQLEQEGEIAEGTVGNLYQVEIPDEKYLLEADTPLSQQSDYVKGAIKKLVDSFGKGKEALAKLVDEDVRGFDFYRGLSNILAGKSVDDYSYGEGDEAASKLLNKYGIEGSVFVDDDERHGRKADGRFYVIFNDKAIKVMQKLSATQEGNGRSTSDLKAEIKEAFPNGKITYEDEETIAFVMPNGQKVTITLHGAINVSNDELTRAKREHGIDEGVTATVEGYAETVGGDGFIALSQASRKGTGFHEAYHIAEAMAFTKKELADAKRLISANEEERADAYAKWKLERKKHSNFAKLWQKIADVAAKMAGILGYETKRNIFRKVESGEIYHRDNTARNTYRQYSLMSDDNSKAGLKRKISNILSGKKESPRYRQRVKNLMEKIAGVRIYYGKMAVGKGMYEPIQKYIRVANANDWDEMTYQFSAAVCDNLGIKWNPGLGTYVSSWLLTGEATNDSEEAKAFREAMAENPNVREQLLDLQDAFLEWNRMSGADQVRNSLSFENEERTSWSDRLNQAYDQFVEELGPIKRLVESIEKKSGVKQSTLTNPYSAFRLFRGAAGRAMTMIEGNEKSIDGLRKLFPAIDWNGFKTIHMILDSIGGLKDKKVRQDFDSYVIAKHVLDIHSFNHGLEGQIAKIDNEIKALGDSDKKKTKELLERRESLRKRFMRTPFTETACRETIKEFDDRFSEAQQDLVHYSNTMLAILHDSGVISDTKYEKLLKKWPNYVPMFRVFDDNDKAQWGDSLKEMQGSSRDPIEPLQSIIRNTFDMVKRAEKNKCKNLLANLAEMDGAGKVLTEVDQSAPQDGTTIVFYRNGEKRYLQTDPAVVSAVNNMGVENASMFIRLLRFPAAIARAAFTVMNPSFIVRNTARDVQDAFVYNKHGYITPMDIVRGFMHAIRQDEVYWEWMASGAAQASAASIDRDYTQSTLDKMTKTNLEKWKNPVNFLTDVLLKFAEVSELGTRIGTYERIKKNLAKDGRNVSRMELAEAALESRDLMDFARGGRSSRTWNRVAIFANASIQGWDKFFRTFDFRKRPKEASLALARLAFASMLPALVLALMNRDKDWWKELPDWQKNTHWILSENIRIPKGQDIGLRATSAIIDKMFDDRPNKLKRGVFDPLWEQTPDIIPTAMLPVIEAMANYSFFRKAPIVPQYQKDLPAKLQYNGTTSSMAKWLGEKLDVSPRKIEHVVYGYGGNLARAGANLYDTATGSKRMNTAVEEMPIMQGFMMTPFKNAQTVTDFYEELQRQKEGDKAFKATHERMEGYNPAKYKRMTQASKKMSELNKKERKLLDDNRISPERKQELQAGIQRQRIAIAKRAMGVK